ncbi:hypothetical protein, partial [Streptomyces boluensis]|uniref:hypothetical protein n=1 Tax=Streptomyces boluensis TaxID=1775135 RepID=UPI0035E438A6
LTGNLTSRQKSQQVVSKWTAAATRTCPQLHIRESAITPTLTCKIAGQHHSLQTCCKSGCL